MIHMMYDPIKSAVLQSCLNDFKGKQVQASGQTLGLFPPTEDDRPQKIMGD